jgi:SNF2 family DNA or RNA helicase
MKNSYYTYESAKDMIMSSDDFIKLNQSNKRTLYLNEAFEDMGKNNKHDFINQIKLFIQTFENYKVQLEAGLPKVNGMLNYVENYDNLRLYVEEFIKYNQIEKHYSEYIKKYNELTEEHIDKKNKDPLYFENAINEIIHHEKIENKKYEVNMEITKLDLIHLVLKLLNSNSPKKEENAQEVQEAIKPKRGRKKKEDISLSPILKSEEKEEEIKMNVKIMIFSDFSSIFKKITPLCDALNIKYVQLDGGNIRSIENAVKAYKFEDTQILFCDSTLFGCGMNFENTTHVIFTHTPNPEMQSQIIGRAQRIGRESILQVYQLHYPNEEMFNIIKKDTDSHMFHFMTAMKEDNIIENDIIQDNGINQDDQYNDLNNDKDDIEGGETNINSL